MASQRPVQRAPFGATVALSVTLAVAGFAVVMPLALTAIRPHVLPDPFPPQNQRAETLSYLLAYLVLLPLAVLAGRRAADRVWRGPNAAALPALVGILAGALAAAIVAVKASGRFEQRDGVGVVLAAAIAWWLATLPVLARAARARPWRSLLALERWSSAIWGLAAVALLVALLCFAQLGSISLAALALGALAAGAACAAHRRIASARPPRALGLAVDALALLVVLALVPDLVIVRPEQAAAGDLAAAIETGIIQFHHDFLLGPAKEVLDGRAMLAGTASQYGVTSIYLLAGWFQLAPIGYGTLGLLTALLTSLWFGAGYAILRLAGTPRLLTSAALAVAVVALVFNLLYPVGALPQSGPLRFGMPMAVVLAAVAGARFPRHARLTALAAAAIVGLASVWSLETFAYSAVVFAAVAAAQAWLAPPPGRLRQLIGQALAAAAACVLAQAVFTSATLAAAGELPAWGEYLAYLREFLAGEIGELTYDVARWTPALPVGAGYVASAAALAELARRRPAAVERERPALVALCGLTTYGIALLSYYVDRSQDHILIYVALPALLTGTLWLGLLLRWDAASDAARRAGLAFALAVAALVVAVAWSSVDDRLERSALAYAAPGGRSLRAALERLWHLPPLAPAAPAGERALERHMPGERASVVIVAPDLGTEILLRSGRADALALGDPWEASFVGDEELPGLRAAVDALRPGTRMLLDTTARDTLHKLRARPSLDPLEDVVGGLALLQQWALARIDDRFRLRPVAPASDGFTVVELVPRG